MTAAIRTADRRGAAWNAAGRIARSDMLSLPLAETVNRGARFALVMMLARQLGPAAYGSWVVAASLGMIIANGGDLGLSTIITRRVAADQSFARTSLANLMAMGPALALTPAAVLTIAALVMGSRSGILLALLGAGALTDSITYLLLAPLRACGKTRPEAALRAGQGGVLLCAGAPLLVLSENAVAVAALFPAVAVISTGVAVWVLAGQFGFARPRLDVHLARSLIIEAMPLFGSVVVTLLYFRADSLLIAWLRGERETGLYGAAYSIVFGVAFVPLMFQRVLLPRLAACGAGVELRDSFTDALRKVAGAGAASACALLIAMPLLTALYGGQFAPARPAYLALVPALAMYFVTYVNYTLLLARSRNYVSLLLTAFALAVNLAVNLALIPPLGALGAALAVLVSEASLLAVQAVLVRRLLAERETGASAASPVLPQREALAA